MTAGIKLAIFDMDDVLVEYNIPRRLETLSGFTGLSPAEVLNRGWVSGFEDRADAGEYLTGERYLAAFNLALGSSISRDQWVEARGRAMTLDPQALALAEALRSSCRIAVLTNNGPMVNEEIHRLVPEVAALFGADFHTSSEFRTKKPNPDIFRRMCASYGVSPSETLFIDDKIENAVGAARAGLFAHHFTGTEGLADFISDHRGRAVRI